MKKIISSFIILALFACKGNENKEQTGVAADSVKTQTVTQYTCPMHPEEISDKPGKCPQCGMDLEVKS